MGCTAMKQRFYFFFSSRRRHTRLQGDWSSDVCSSDLPQITAADHEYRAVQASGHWLAGKTVLTQAVTELGAGFWVLTPLQMDDGNQVLVNRGFIPTAQRARWQDQPAQAPQDPVTVDGLLRISEPRGGFLRENDPAQQRWFSRDVAAIAQAQGLDHAEIGRASCRERV